MPNRVWDDDPTIPPPGCRTGNGSGSILPYLVKSLASKPRDGLDSELQPLPAQPQQPQEPRRRF